MKNQTPHAFKVVAVGAATAALMTVGLGAASAHVSVTPDAPAEGTSTQVTFRVPSESKTATTTKIKVDLPTDTPLTSVRVKPVQGWTTEIVRGALPQPITVDGATITEAPLSVTWTANDAQSQLTGDQYQMFSVYVGRLPKSGTTVTLPLTQSYSDGSVRNWDDPVVEGQKEPEDPAPAFVTTAAESGEGGHAGATAAKQATEPVASVDTNAPAPGLIWAALATGLAGLAAGVASFLRAGRNKKS
ncbi:YcnI family protein [Pseudarthrobacter sp. H3Y2-7]|uniref:YcnI family copper-binding membrane protein n=1 Tax=Pseudarthrobacter naphthalenicus TaxID=3031328 RepID=UPI0023B20474|nr:YcnI family protein [Pseudarthrobacter sp. H3Y2-7]MDE8670009.1 YcnI family protein [Pseudarthrobacter sp. H3Y2-7]